MAFDPTELNLTLNQIQQCLNLLKAFQSAQHIMTQVAHAEGAVTDAHIRQQQVEADIAGLEATFQQRWHEHKAQVTNAWTAAQGQIAQWEDEAHTAHQERLNEWAQQITALETAHDTKCRAYADVVQKEMEAIQTHEAGMAARRDAIQQLEDRQAYCQHKAEEALRAQQSAENMHRQRMTDMQEEEQKLQQQVDRLKDLLSSLKAVAQKLASE